jgi:hypothetical protein
MGQSHEKAAEIRVWYVIIDPNFLLKGTCSSPNSKLDSGKECYVYGKLSAGILESGAPILNTKRYLPDSKLEFRLTLLLCIWKTH